MSEQAAAAVVGHIAAPVVAALLEQLHVAESEEITRIEANLPGWIATAPPHAQDWANDLIAAFHRGVARIEGARSNVQAATTAGPTVAETATSSATSTAPAATAPQDATTKAATK